MSDIRIVFMGTPDFAVTVLEGLLARNWSVVGVVTQPDKPVGRKQILEPTPVKKIALEHHIPVFQPLKIKSDYEFMNILAPDLIITCAYGQIVPQGLLDIPRLGCMNVHASLLPRLRGGAPIQRAIMKGYNETGVTLMQMIAKMDAGVMYAKKAIPIEMEDTSTTLFRKLAIIGRDLLLDNLESYLSGSLKGIPQDESLVTFAPNIKPEEERIDWNQPSNTIHNLVRALADQPGAFTRREDLTFKVWKTLLVEGLTLNALPGTILNISKEGLLVQTHDGGLLIEEIQWPGKNRNKVNQLINGNFPLKIGDQLR